MRDLLERLSSPTRKLLLRIGRLAARRAETVYLVGGTVRDLVLGRPGEDLDVVVVGDGMDLAQALARAMRGKLTRYHAFQTARIDLPGGLRVDVATARGEDYPRPGGLPRVRAGSLEEDLARRDFTINAVASCLLPDRFGELADPFDGLADIDRGLIRFLHEGSFVDDPTRMLRALRFALRFDYELEERTGRALADGARGLYLDEVSGDRLRREVTKLFDEAPVGGPVTLREHELLVALHAGLVAVPELLDRLQRETRQYRQRVGEEGELAPGWTRVLALLARPLQPRARWELVRRLRLSRRQRRPVIESGAPWERALVRLEEAGSPDVAEVATEIADLGDDSLLVALAGMGPDREELRGLLRRTMRERIRVEVALDGQDLLAMGCPEGPEVGELLAALRAARLRGDVASEEEERTLAGRLLEIDRPEGA